VTISDFQEFTLDLVVRSFTLVSCDDLGFTRIHFGFGRQKFQCQKQYKMAVSGHSTVESYYKLTMAENYK